MSMFLLVRTPAQKPVGFMQNPKDGRENLILIGNTTGYTSMSWKMVGSIFRGESTFWKNGAPVTIVLPGNTLSYSVDVANYVYGSSVPGMQKFWLSLVFQGRSKPPIFLNTEQEIIDFISRNPGSVGFVSASAKSKCVDLLIVLSDK